MYSKNMRVVMISVCVLCGCTAVFCAYDAYGLFKSENSKNEYFTKIARDRLALIDEAEDQRAEPVD